MSLRSLTLNTPFGCILSDLKEPELIIQQSPGITSNIASQMKFP